MEWRDRMDEMEVLAVDGHTEEVEVEEVVRVVYLHY